jgi:hypothetical protein
MHFREPLNENEPAKRYHIAARRAEVELILVFLAGSTKENPFAFFASLFTPWNAALLPSEG